MKDQNLNETLLLYVLCITLEEAHHVMIKQLKDLLVFFCFLEG